MADTAYGHGNILHRLYVPLPGFEDLECSNMYVVGTGPITLIDTAPKFPGSLFTLERQLNHIGFSWDDVERIIITHGHIDHFGLVESIRKASGRPIACYVHKDDLWRLSEEFLASGMFSSEVESFYEKAGVPARIVKSLKRRLVFFRNLCDPVSDALPLEDGERITGRGWDLTVVHTPGHSPGCCCLYEPHQKILFTGDHLLKNITPNPFHEAQRSRLADPGYKSLFAYLKSLERVESLDVSLALPGHGPSIDDLGGILDAYRRHHEERARAIEGIIQDGARSLYDIACTLFGALDAAQIPLAVSETYVHLELLLDRGAAVVMQEGPPVLYSGIPKGSALS